MQSSVLILSVVSCTQCACKVMDVWLSLQTGESSSYALYGQHLQKEREKQRKALAAELQALSPRSLHSPCSG